MSDNTDRMTINNQEYEVSKNTGELIPLCHWLSYDTCILENICCDGKGRCKCILNVAFFFPSNESEV